MRKIEIVAMFAVLSLILFGCAQSAVEFANGKYNGEIFDYNNHRITYEDNFENSVETTCSCMICENASTSMIAKIFGTPTLRNGSCYFMKDCNITNLKDLLDERENATLKTFMVGTGSTFFESSASNAFCKNGQDIAVKWVIGTESDPYPTPEPDRAGCLLNNNVIPMYVLYSNGTKLKEANMEAKAYDFAYKFNDLGPVIIVGEINFNESDAEKAALQVRSIKSGCPNCLVALAPKVGDTKALDKAMGNIKSNGPMVDLIAVGVDSRYYNISCDPEQLIYYARNFSQYAMVKYQIPSIWPYMIIEEGKEVKTSDKESCNWDSDANAVMNSDLFLTEMPNALRDGVIGAVRYSYSGLINPLNVTSPGEAYVGPSPDGGYSNIINNIEPRFSHWYAFCAVYSTDYVKIAYDTKEPQIVSNRMYVVFPNQSNMSNGCEGVQNLRYYYSFTDFGKNSEYITNSQPGSIAPIPPNDLNGWNSPLPKPYYRCDYCIRSISDATDMPFPSVKSSGPSSSYHGEDMCTAYADVDLFADKLDVDPWFVKAIMLAESGGNECAFSKAKLSAGCNKLNVLDPIYDPEGQCPPTADMNEVKECDEAGTNCVQQKVCAMGLMQNNELPYTYWDKKSSNWYESSASAGGDWSPKKFADRCFADYNPFNQTHSICVGTNKINDKWNTVGKTYADDLEGACPNIFPADEALNAQYKKWWRAVFTASSYLGIQSSMYDYAVEYCGYLNGQPGPGLTLTYTVVEKDADGKPILDEDGQPIITEKTRTFTDYLEFVYEFHKDDLKENKGYVRSILHNYWGLTKCSNSDCPYGKLSSNIKN